jgi:hypothetical protein
MLTIQQKQFFMLYALAIEKNDKIEMLRNIKKILAISEADLFIETLHNLQNWHDEQT